jgi:hypothetical protein
MYPDTKILPVFIGDLTYDTKGFVLSVPLKEVLYGGNVS